MRLPLVLVALLTAALAGAAAGAQPAPLAVSVDCPGYVPGCDTVFFQTETPWARFVRDPADADAAVLVVAQGTGDGGTRYELSAASRRTGRRDTLVAFARPDATPDAQRRLLLGRLHLALVPFLASSPLADGIRLHVDAPPAGAPPPPASADPWRGWTFRLSLNGSAQAQQSVASRFVNVSARASRVTERWIVRGSVYGNESRTRFDLADSTTLAISNGGVGAFGVVVRSVSPRAGVGVYTVVERSTFENYALRAELAPGVEANLYPYGESARRQLRLQYELGAATAAYVDTTIFGRTAETFPFHELELKAIFAQPWGSLDARAEVNQVLGRANTYRAELGGNVSLRLRRGLTLDVSASAARIRDQINLVRGDATDEEVITQRRELETGYQMFAFVGLSYPFGSAFNPAVNVRFD